VTAGVDTALANAHSGVVFGEALGQVFLASDTLIQSITVWRWAVQDTSNTAMRLYITAADSVGGPDVASILFRSSPLFIPYGDGVHHIPHEFVFDPPLALPHRGLFCFAVQAVPCDGTWSIISSTQNAYTDGSLWVFGRSACSLRLGPHRYPDYDLIFRIRYCDSSTPTHKTTWGKLKTLYRP